MKKKKLYMFFKSMDKISLLIVSNITQLPYKIIFTRS